MRALTMIDWKNCQFASLWGSFLSQNGVSSVQKSNSKQPQSSKPAINTLPSQQRGMVFSSILLIVIIAGMVLLALYLVKLDRTITHKFEGKRWDIPAKVYSQPLELYQGANVDTDTMKKWLELLNYQSNKSYDRTGTYHKSGNTYFIHTRGVTYNANDVDKEQVTNHCWR